MWYSKLRTARLLADVAQLAEHLICNQQVAGSSPIVGSKFCSVFGEVAEWLKAADCKSAPGRVRRFESSPLHHFILDAGIAQLVERQPSKLNVAGSSPVSRSRIRL